ncbi:hypothetical protein [Arcobacter sp. FWKO B]|nr:hypothetical protein [Arcobacter sp. FWKO B]
MAKLTTLPYLSYGFTIFESRFDFETPREFHPQMPPIQYKRFIYE